MCLIEVQKNIIAHGASLHLTIWDGKKDEILI
jgi:hypothetical protein